MSKFLEHKGYAGSVQYSPEDEVFHGKLEGIRDLVTYEATDVVSLKRNFEEAVEDYLKTCQKKNRDPQVPYKGSFNVRVGSDLHKRAAVLAFESHKNLNTIVSEALKHYLETASC